MVDVGPALVGLAIVEEIGTDDHVAVAVAVDVAGGGHGNAQAGVGLIALGGPGGDGGQRVDGQRVAGVSVVEDDAQAPHSRLGEALHPCRQLTPVGVSDQQVGIAQHLGAPRRDEVDGLAVGADLW